MWLLDLFFLISANPTCRGPDISKYLRESHGLRDHESRLYIHVGLPDDVMELLLLLYPLIISRLGQDFKHTFAENFATESYWSTGVSSRRQIQ